VGGKSVEKESLKLVKSDVKDLYFLYYKDNPIAAIILNQDGISIKVGKSLVEAINISEVSIYIKVK
jgi:predicted nuclease with TOPRIM domain